MFPIVLDLTRVSILLYGNSALVLNRLKLLDEAKAARVSVFCANPDESLVQAAGERLLVRAPDEDDIKSNNVIMVAGAERSESETIKACAQSQGKIINVEDVTDLCDFYFTSNLRRGDLLIAVSTAGASPTLAKKIRDKIGVMFGLEWTERVQFLAELRARLKAQNLGMKDVMAQTEQVIAEKGWLS